MEEEGHREERCLHSQQEAGKWGADLLGVPAWCGTEGMAEIILTRDIDAKRKRATARDRKLE